MKEIRLPNGLELKVCINGMPDLANMLKDPMVGFNSVIQLIAEKIVQDNYLSA